MDITKRPMFFAAVVCCVAAAVSLYVKALAFAVVSVALIIFIVISLHKSHKYITVALAILLFALGLFSQFERIDKINACDNRQISGSFLVVSDPQPYEKFNAVTLQIENCDLLPRGTKIFAFDYNCTKLKIGDKVTAELKLSTIKKYDEYRLYDYSNGIYATASVRELKNTGVCNRFYKFAGNIRAYAKKSLSSRFKGDTAAFLTALTIGDKTMLGDTFSNNVKTTGISHVIVVSGMHLSIIMTAVFWCLDRMFYNKYIRCALSVAAVVLISAVCGFTMSIIRAGVMFIITGVAPILNRDNDSLSSLLTTVTVVLIGAPFAIFNVSFQLSVLSTLAIIWAVPFYYQVIIRRFNISSKIVKYLLTTVLCSLFAIIFTLPVTVKLFGYASIVSPITNFVISYPLMTALISNIAALTISVIPVFKIFGELLFGIAGFFSRFIVFAVNNIAKLPITVAVLPKSAFFWSLAFVAAVIGYMYYSEFKKKRCDFNADSI